MTEEQLSPEEKERTELLFSVLIDIRNALIRIQENTNNIETEIKKIKSEVVGDD